MYVCVPNDTVRYSALLLLLTGALWEYSAILGAAQRWGIKVGSMCGTEVLCDLYGFHLNIMTTTRTHTQSTHTHRQTHTLYGFCGQSCGFPQSACETHQSVYGFGGKTKLIETPIL